MGHGGYGVPQKSINERCIDQIKASGGAGFDFKKMHATLRILAKLAEAKFLGDIEVGDFVSLSYWLGSRQC